MSYACSLCEMTMTRRWRPRDKARVEDSEGSHGCGWLERVPWLAGSRFRGRHFSGVMGAKEFHKCICKHYICVLLIKTNQMMYNM